MPRNVCAVVVLATVSTFFGCVDITVTTDATPAGGATVTAGCGGDGGGGGAGGAGGEVVGPENDACPGAAYQLGFGDSVLVAGSTANATDDYASFCGNAASAPDVVYAITIEQEGTFKLSVHATEPGLNPVVYVRTSCADDATTLGCFDFGDDHEDVAGQFEPGVYYVIVDGSQGTQGAFELAASLNPPACGDGVLNTGEQCDNGAPIADDGCADPGDPIDTPCTFQTPSVNKDVCPGEPFVLTPSGLSLLASQGHFTTGFTDDYASVGCPGAGGAPDRVYQIVASVDGTMTASVGYEADGQTATCDVDITSPGCFDRILYVRSNCGDAASELGCSDVGAIDPEVVTVPVFAGNSYYVFVDGYDGDILSQGAYNLIITLAPN